MLDPELSKLLSKVVKEKTGRRFVGKYNLKKKVISLPIFFMPHSMCMKKLGSSELYIPQWVRSGSGSLSVIRASWLLFDRYSKEYCVKKSKAWLELSSRKLVFFLYFKFEKKTAAVQK